MLSLQPRFHYVNRGSDHACEASSNGGAHEVPSCRICLVPWLNKSLEVLIYTDYSALERQIHKYSDGEGLHEAFEAIRIKDVRY